MLQSSKSIKLRWLSLFFLLSNFHLEKEIYEMLQCHLLRDYSIINTCNLYEKQVTASTLDFEITS